MTFCSGTSINAEEAYLTHLAGIPCLNRKGRSSGASLGPCLLRLFHSFYEVALQLVSQSQRMLTLYPSVASRSCSRLRLGSVRS